MGLFRMSMYLNVSNRLDFFMVLNSDKLCSCEKFHEEANEGSDFFVPSLLLVLSVCSGVFENCLVRS